MTVHSQNKFTSTKITFVLLFLTSFMQVAWANYYNKVTLSNPDALCLDGSPGVYYVHQGALAHKWIIAFDGGGWCGSSKGMTETLDSCLKRSKGILGSSINYPDIWKEQEGILSDHSSNYYQNWSIAIFKYCTGVSHQGYKKDPIQHKGSNLYFRGHNVTIAQLDSLHSTYSLFTALTTDIIVYGQSAGGLAVFLWTNYIKDRASPSTRVISLPDAGIFLDFKSYLTGKNQFRRKIQNLMAIANVEISPPVTECNDAHPTELWKCMFAEYISEYITVPLFTIQSPYDFWCIKNILQISCEGQTMSLAKCNLDQNNYIEQFHTKMKSVLQSISTYNWKNGYWSPSCCNHVYTDRQKLYSKSFRIPSGSQNSIIKGIAEWQQEQAVSYLHMDNGSWPINSGCSGISEQQQQILIILLIALLVLAITAWTIKKWLQQKAEKRMRNIKLQQSECQLDQKN